MEQKLQRRLTFIFHELEYLFWFWIAEEMQSESPKAKKKKLSRDAFLESFIAKSYRVFSTY